MTVFAPAMVSHFAAALRKPTAFTIVVKTADRG
jgi:hypothetical protein